MDSHQSRRPRHPATPLTACDADCTLREAITAAQVNDTINFTPGLSGTITLRATLNLIRAITIDGPGADLIAIDGNQDPSDPEGEFRILIALGSVAQLTIRGVTLRNGFASGTDLAGAGGAIRVTNTLVLDRVVIENSRATDKGGGIFVEGYLTVTKSIIRGNSSVGSGGGFAAMGGVSVTDSTIANNSSTGNNTGAGGFFVLGNAVLTRSSVRGNSANGVGGGFALSDQEPVTLTNMTISDNSTTSDGGGFWLFGDATIVNCTISNNTAGGDGGGFTIVEGARGASTSGVARLRNSLVADNSAVGEWNAFLANMSDITFSLIEGTSSPHLTHGVNGNIIGVDPKLGPLQDNGGTMWTRILLPTSPSIDAGQNSTCAATDQRGGGRPRDGDGNGSALCDMGAVEMVIDPVFANGFEGP